MNGNVYKQFLQWRDIDEPCHKCGGRGWATYGNTSTWRHGVGGQTLAKDVCDRCWGSGDEHNHWTDLRKVSRKFIEYERKLEDKKENLNEPTLD